MATVGCNGIKGPANKERFDCEGGDCTAVLRVKGGQEATISKSAMRLGRQP